MRILIGNLMAAFILALCCAPAHANSKSSEPAPVVRSDIPRMAEEEYHAKLKTLSVPGLRRGQSPKRGKQIKLDLVVVTEDEDDLVVICHKAASYRDALLTLFHTTPVVLNRRGGIYDTSALVKQVSEVLIQTLGNEIVTGVRLASENVPEYAEKSYPCSR
ncbi:MAG: hypothetical protein HQ511_07170 [Rhodospirillales bacterium]|nr:hypothetical protein [Rhodospirillales bacterium]